MWSFVAPIAGEVLHVLGAAFHNLLAPGLFFIALAVLVKGRAALMAGRRATRETCINLSVIGLDALLIAPPLAVLLVVIGNVLDLFGRPLTHGLHGPKSWSASLRSSSATSSATGDTVSNTHAGYGPRMRFITAIRR